MFLAHHQIVFLCCPLVAIKKSPNAALKSSLTSFVHKRSHKTYQAKERGVKLLRTQKIISVLSYCSSSHFTSSLLFLTTRRWKAFQRLRDGGLLCPKGEGITGEPQYLLMVESIELIRTHGSTNVHLELIWIFSASFGFKIERRRDSEAENLEGGTK